MASKKTGLGKGLDVLLDSLNEQLGEPAVQGRLCQLPLDLIQPCSYQPRQAFNPEQLQELADSIRQQGIIQPVVVRELKEGNYELVAGERRWRAAQLAELTTIPAIVRELSEQAAAALALIENIQRENLNPIDEAQGLQRLLQEFAMTHQQVAEAVGRSRTAITNQLRLLHLPVEVQELLSTSKLHMGHARALLGLPVEWQSKAAQQIVVKDLSVRATERLVQRLQNPPKSPEQATDPHIQSLQEELAQQLGAKVVIQHTAKGKGKLEIHYHNLDELDGIIERFKEEA